MNQHEQFHLDDLHPEADPVQLQFDFHSIKRLQSPPTSMTFFMHTLNLMLERKFTKNLATPRQHR